MFGASRSQVAIYAVIAAVLLLVGFNSLRDEAGSGLGPQGSGPAAQAAGGGAPDSNQASGPESGFEISADRERLVVDVSGGVRRPGVYRFAEGARVIDAIARAGGVTGLAIPGAINRAAKLADGQQVVVPVQAGAGGGSVAGVAAGGIEAPISLGTATPEQLEEIEGIGPVTASQIIEFRDSKGGLGSIDELDQVSGIGPVTMEALRSRLQP